MDQAPQTYRFQWQGIEIEARYWPLKWGVASHLEIESIAPERAPLPVSETGYCSHFHPRGIIEARGGDVVQQVMAWLDEEGCRPAWQAMEASGRQGELF